MIANDYSAEILKELIQIKRLIIVHMLKNGADGKDLSSALGVSKQRISQLFPVKIYKRYK